MTSPQPWTTLQSTLAFDHPWYKVRQDVVRLPNGTVIDDYFLGVLPDVAMVLPLTPAQEIVLVRQYRHGAGAVLLELPAGTFDPSLESAEQAARRELQEETGYRAERLSHLQTVYDNPVKETNKIHLFVAQDVYPGGKQQLDQTEEIELVLLPVAEVLPAMTQGKLCVSGTIAALVLGLNALGLLNP